MRWWTCLSYMGDLAVLLPCMAVMVVWMAVFLRLALLRWLLSLASIGSAIFFTKLLFMAWGLGIPSLDFIGVSGHSALAAFVWPTLFAFLFAGLNQSWRWAGAGLGFLLALGIGVSRIELRVHSIAEVAAGLMLSTATMFAFLRSTSRLRLEPKVSLWLVPFIVAAVWFGYGKRFPSEYLLRQIALRVSPDGEVRTRQLLERTR